MAIALVWTAAMTHSQAFAQWFAPDDMLRITYGPAAIHFNSSPEHVDFNHLVALDWLTSRWTIWKADRSIVGFAVFDNSFGQFSQYLYGGLEWTLWPLGGGEFYVDLTAGLMHGYSGIYKNKIPLNNLGVAPVIVPALGWRRSGVGVSVMILGTAGLLFGISYAFLP